MITVNGRKISWIENETVRDLLKRMRYTFTNIVVKIDNELVKRKDYDNTLISDGAEIKMIHMISGG